MINRNEMQLKYRHRENDTDEWEFINQSITITSSECNFGGERKWFMCLRCLDRVTSLYGLSKYFYCRKCYRLPYRSILETDADRLYTKKHALGEEIFEHYENGDGWLKKKGMHQKTFDKKLVEYQRLEMQIGAHTLDYINKLNNKF